VPVDKTVKMDAGRELLAEIDELIKCILSFKQMAVGILNALEDVQKCMQYLILKTNNLSDIKRAVLEHIETYIEEKIVLA
jgi:hypothetical protein